MKNTLSDTIIKNYRAVDVTMKQPDIFLIA